MRKPVTGYQLRMTYCSMDTQNHNQPTGLLRKKRIALVHDFLVSYGGAERVLQTIAEMFPEAPIYTLLGDRALVERHFPGREVRFSWLQSFPNFLKKRYRWLLPFFPVAVETIDLRDYDLVISSSGAWSKGIVTRLNTKHVAYLHSPMRYVWDYHENYLSELKPRGYFRFLTRLLLSYIRVWDRQAAERPDALIVNSRYTQARVEKYYRRESLVIYPGAMELAEKMNGVSANRGGIPRPARDDCERRHFLVVSRLTRSKKVDVVVEAFNKLELPLVITGEGPERKRLEKIAGQAIRFTGYESDEALASLYRNARAVIFPSEEDFGMVAAEALSFGTPVIAFEYGGIREIVHEGATGELFHAQTPEVLAEGVRRFLANEGRYDQALMKQSVEKLSKENFQKEMRGFLESKLK